MPLLWFKKALKVMMYPSLMVGGTSSLWIFSKLKSLLYISCDLNCINLHSSLDKSAVICRQKLPMQGVGGRVVSHSVIASMTQFVKKGKLTRLCPSTKKLKICIKINIYLIYM